MPDWTLVIQHVTRQIPPARLEQCIAFYALLGFEQVPVPEGIAGRAVWLERAGTQIHLMPRDEAVPEQGHVGIVAADYEATVRRLQTQGHEVEPRREHWGSPRGYVHDPAGNLVEVMAWPPGVPGSSPPRGPRE
jgi:catechol 2,3-dioxygenase-like lactoylglutathione lyase family enzyme